jgi:flagellar biosynthesis protein FlhB
MLRSKFESSKSSDRNEETVLAVPKFVYWIIESSLADTLSVVTKIFNENDSQIPIILLSLFQNSNCLYILETKHFISNVNLMLLFIFISNNVQNNVLFFLCSVINTWKSIMPPLISNFPSC